VILLGRAQRDAARQSLAHVRLADIYLREGNPSRARLELNRSLELAPDDPKVHFKMARVLRLLGDAEGAAEAGRRYEELLRGGKAGEGRTEAPASP
jgi:Tfp pilus assembly protein PilF